MEKSFITIATDVKNRLIADGGSGGPAAGAHKLAAGAGNNAGKKGCC